MAYDPAYYQANKAKYIERAKAWDAANPEAVKARKERFHQANPHKAAEYKRKARYGLSAAQYDALLAEQGGHCATCPSTDKLSVDHDHGSGAVRGILCHRCNVAIGYALNSPETLRALAEYLDR